jgi:hypothetical protein
LTNSGSATLVSDIYSSSVKDVYAQYDSLGQCRSHYRLTVSLLF